MRPEDESTSESESTEEEENEDKKKSSSGSTVTSDQTGIESDNENQPTQPPGEIVAHTPSTVSKGGHDGEKSILRSDLDKISEEIKDPYRHKVPEQEQADTMMAWNLAQKFENT